MPDMANGFLFEAGEWKHAKFSVTGQSMVIAEVTPYDMGGTEKIGVEITHTGDMFPTHRCAPFEERAQIACGGLGYGFLFNSETLRFQENYGLGYVDGGDSPDNTPSITIGACSKLPDRR